MMMYIINTERPDASLEDLSPARRLLGGGQAGAVAGDHGALFATAQVLRGRGVPGGGRGLVLRGRPAGDELRAHLGRPYRPHPAVRRGADVVDRPVRPGA